MCDYVHDILSYIWYCLPCCFFCVSFHEQHQTVLLLSFNPGGVYWDDDQLLSMGKHIWQVWKKNSEFWERILFHRVNREENGPWSMLSAFYVLCFRCNTVGDYVEIEKIHSSALFNLFSLVHEWSTSNNRCPHNLWLPPAFRCPQPAIMPRY